MIVFLFLFAALQICSGQTPKDTTKTVITPSITVSSTTANEQSSVTFSDITAKEIRNSYTVQDIAQNLSMLPSIYSVSQNGNNIGYTSISLRGFDQRRIAVMINGVPQ
ncbi:MAG: TonB-dependent receptor plug domain-containing protein, partial [Candidatus Kapaibacteriota bacterium]